MAVKYLVGGADGDHLPVSDESGAISHRLMGAAWAALHGGYRGNTYDGPGKDAALANLTALYKSEGLATPGGATTAAERKPPPDAAGDDDPGGDESEAMDEPGIGDVHVDGPLGAPKKPRFLTRLRELVGGTVKSKGYLSAEDWAAHQRTARAHAGGMARSTKAAETPATPPADYAPCAACKDGDEDACTCPGCNADQACWCCQMLDPDQDGDVDNTGARAGAEYARSSTGERFRLFLPCAFGEAPEWIPYLPKPGRFKHTVYGEMTFTQDGNADFVRKFNAGVYQTDGAGNPHIPIDAEHQTKASGAMGWIDRLRLNEDGSADAHVAWTGRGKSMLADDRYKFFSPEIYPEWEDPLTGKMIRNVAIGGAITTRPFFKTNAQGQSLRALVASEQGMYMPDDDPQPVPARAGETPDHAPRGQEVPMSTNDVQTSPAPVQLTEAEIQHFREVERKYQEAQALIEQANTQAQQATERVAALERDGRRRTFAEQAHAWHGPVADHVAFMEGLTDEQLAFYRRQQDGLAAMLKDSLLFTEIGRPGADADGGADAKLRGIARTFREADPTLTEAKAYVKALEANPDLYARSLAE